VAQNLRAAPPSASRLNVNERRPLQNELSQARGGRVQDRRHKPINFRDVYAELLQISQGNRRQILDHNRRTRDAARYPLPMEVDEL